MHIFTYLTMAAVFIAAPIIVQATPRYDESLCEEVAYALYEAVDFGTITQEVADEVTSNCYDLFST